MTIKPLKVMLARFPARNEHPAEVNFAIDLEKQCAKDRRIENLSHYYIQDTPTDMCRNLAVKVAQQNGMDILVMVDDDMGPDLVNPAKTFWEIAIDFIISRWDSAPTIIAAPYCSAPPSEEVLIFRWENRESDNPNPDYQIKRFSRYEATKATGIEAVAALPTGLIAMDMRIFNGFNLADGRVIKLPHPYFSYEWTDITQTAKASTEDVVFSRNASLLFHKYGLETCFVAWDAWAIHYKVKAVGKPVIPNGGGLARLLSSNTED